MPRTTAAPARPSKKSEKSTPKKPAPKSAPAAAAPKKSPRKATKKPFVPPADPAMAHWLEFFSRYHATHALRPFALSLLPQPVPVSETQSSRYVFEVAQKFEEDGEKWLLIAWEIDIPGIRLRDCANQQEAMELFERRYIYGPGVGTVRLRADFRPW